MFGKSKQPQPENKEGEPEKVEKPPKRKVLIYIRRSGEVEILPIVEDRIDLVTARRGFRKLTFSKPDKPALFILWEQKRRAKQKPKALAYIAIEGMATVLSREELLQTPIAKVSEEQLAALVDREYYEAYIDYVAKASIGRVPKSLAALLLLLGFMGGILFMIMILWWGGALHVG